ncbi:MAG: hypothetical protein M3083_11775 [Actinomycetota bacterium]|nr:hypothetical protein [Actinomycetota bacterium]
MDDRDVIETFITSGARRAFGPEVHVEGDALFLAGWWQTAFRVAPGVFMLRNEEPPDGSSVIEHLAEALSAAGLNEVGVDLPAMTLIVYTELTLADVSWTLWAADLPSGEQALEKRVTAESVFGGPASQASEPDLGGELGGARRLAGLAPWVILTVGLDSAVVDQLEAGLAECRFVSRGFSDIGPDGCGTLMPTLIMVDATEEVGRDFVEGLRSDVFCRFLPVAAVTPELQLPSGADISFDPSTPPGAWVEPLRRILP